MAHGDSRGPFETCPPAVLGAVGPKGMKKMERRDCLGLRFFSSRLCGVVCMVPDNGTELSFERMSADTEVVVACNRDFNVNKGRSRELGN